MKHAADAAAGALALAVSAAAVLAILDAPLPFVPAAILAGVPAAAAIGLYLLAGKKVPWTRFGVQAGAAAIAAATAWTWTVLPVLAHGPAALTAPAPIAVHLFRVAPAVLAVGLAAPALQSLLAGVSGLFGLLGLARRRKRRESRISDLYGRARFLAARHVRTLTRRRGLLLGQVDDDPRSPLVAWRLEGHAITLAPPRTGKGATIALNHLSPDDRGWPGGTVLIDPRGETFPIVARRRRELGRRPILLDPFGVVAGHKRNFTADDGRGDLHLPHWESDRYNPLDFIRDDEAEAVRDIHVLLDALLTPPSGESGNSTHFHASARALISGYIAWVRFREPPARRTLATVHEMLCASTAERDEFIARIRAAPDFPCHRLARDAAERQAQVGPQEAGSNFSTVLNQLGFLNFPELVHHTSASTFDPMDLAEGDIDLFIVVPGDQLGGVRNWLRLWITIPYAVSSRRPLKREMLIMVDEMPQLGKLQTLLDAYLLSAGQGVHFWCFAQSISALDMTWGRDASNSLLDNAELVQILGFPRMGTQSADTFSKAMGTGSFESISESDRDGASKSQSVGIVREHLVSTDDILTMDPDKQYVIAAPKDMPRDTIRLGHARYWLRPDLRPDAELFDPNPFVVRKHAAGETFA